MNNHKAGFVNIIGNPNVGKSTLMNSLVGEKLSIISPKAQTTRHRIFGIINGENFQIVVSDTPGIINPHYSLHKSMMRFVDTALQDADIVLYVTDIYDNPEKNPIYIERIALSDSPLLVIINKIDLSNQSNIEQLVEQWHQRLPKAQILPVSALRSANTNMVLQFIMHHLPVSPPYFPKDELTDKTMRFIISEIVREKIFFLYKKEIPYSVEVVVEEYRETKNRIDIDAVIYTERETQKGIIIGHQARMIKKVGIEARKDIETFVDKHVFLKLNVKVDPDWRNNEMKLKRYGYIF